MHTGLAFAPQSGFGAAATTHRLAFLFVSATAAGSPLLLAV
jgi:hypothetical protein